MRRQAQAAIEFVLLTAVMLLFFTSVFIITQSLYVDIQEERMQQQVYNFFGMLDSELLVAHQVGEGYDRHIRIPLTFSGLDYDLWMNLNQTSQSKDEIVLTIHGQNYLYFLTAPVNGTIEKGWHLIRGGEVVQIQPSSPPE